MSTDKQWLDLIIINTKADSKGIWATPESLISSIMYIFHANIQSDRQLHSKEYDHAMQT